MGSMINVNREYVKKNLEAWQNVTGKSFAELGRAMGYGANYIYISVKRGRFRKPALMQLCQITGLDFEKATAAPDKQQAVRESTEQADAEKLGEVIERIDALGRIAADIMETLHAILEELK